MRDLAWIVADNDLAAYKVAYRRKWETDPAPDQIRSFLRRDAKGRQDCLRRLALPREEKGL